MVIVFILTRPVDYQILRDGLKMARRLGQTAPLSSSLLTETAPGSHVQTDAQWEQWLRDTTTSEFHPSSSCAMLPLDQGGVVDANLRVYGLANVRVADASVPPIALSTHLMASTYGLAEQASSIIRAAYGSNVSADGGRGSGGGGGTGSGTGGGAKSSHSSASTRNASVSYSRQPLLLLLFSTVGFLHVTMI
jgi:choline dehydrogenase